MFVNTQTISMNATAPNKERYNMLNWSLKTMTGTAIRNVILQNGKQLLVNFQT